jgi:hypothetical protein
MRKRIVLFAIATVGALAAPGVSSQAQSVQSQGSKTAQSPPGGVKHSAAPRQAKPDPNLDLVGSWVPIAGDTSSNVTIEFGKDKMSRVTECWLTVGQGREQCDFKRMGKRLAVNGYGVPDDQNLTPENFIVLAGLDGDVLKGKVYPSKSQFTIYLHGGTTETRLLQEAAQEAQARAAAEQARQAEAERQQRLAQERAQQEVRKRAEARRELEEDARLHPTWVDPSTKLMWNRIDSGAGNLLTWQEALDYCKNLSVEGHSDWRLATIDEEAGIFDPGNLHTKANIPTSPGHLITYWSSTPKGEVKIHRGQASGEALYFDFYHGMPHSLNLGSKSFRALCVRASGG